MDRQRYLRQRRWRPLILLARLVGVAAVFYGSYLGLNYIMKRSAAEVAALQNRPAPTDYLGAESVRMTVIDDRGLLTMEITGRNVALSSDQRTATFTDAQAKYFENGRESLNIEAGKIEYDTQSEDFRITRGDAADALRITTHDGWTVRADEVEWRRFKHDNPLSPGARPPSFRFPKGVEVASSEGNLIKADYMQADKDLSYMEFVGNFRGTIKQLQDTQFISERKLTDVGTLQLDDFENLYVAAEQVIYDKRNQVVLATSRFYDRGFAIKDFDGNIIQVSQYQQKPQQVMFKKPEAIIAADHLEAHLSRKWAESFGNITMILPPAAPEPGDDAALKEMKQHETRISAGDIEYFWGRDYVISHDRTVVEQQDRRAEADKITYWGDERMVLLDGGVFLAQGSGDWLTSANLIAVKDADQARMTQGYTELAGDRAVVYLNNNDFVASGSVSMRQDNREVAADTVVYQNDAQKLTAKGNVKFRDLDGQTFLTSALIYNNDTEYMRMEGGAAATIRLPARYANDINRTIADSREEPPPPEITDPPVPDEPTRNPNEGSTIGDDAFDILADAGGQGLAIPSQPPPISGSPGFVPDNPDDDLFIGPQPPSGDSPAREFLLQLGGEGEENELSEITPERPAPGTREQNRPAREEGQR